MPHSIHRRAVIAALGAAPFAALAQGAANFPSRQIRLVVPFPPGGSVDPLARVFATEMGKTFGQQAMVDNRPGGNTVIGTDAAAKAAPDGHTLLLTASSHVTQSQLLTTPYDPIKDFVTVATVCTSDLMLAVHPSVPVNNLKEFLALAKSKPGQLNYGSAGNGNPTHLAAELMNMMAGVKTTHVPYKGGSQVVADLLAGQLQFAFSSPIITAPHIAAGKLRPIAVTAPKRQAILPNVPTMAEAGLPGYDIQVWYGFLAPAGTPADVVAKLKAEIDRIVALPETRQRLATAGMDPFTATAPQFAALLRSDHEKFGKIIKAANIKLD